MANVQPAPQVTVVQPATKTPTPKFSKHEATGQGTKLLQDEADAHFARCGAHQLCSSENAALNPCGDPSGTTTLLEEHEVIANMWIRQCLAQALGKTKWSLGHSA